MHIYDSMETWVLGLNYYATIMAQILGHHQMKALKYFGHYVDIALIKCWAEIGGFS